MSARGGPKRTKAIREQHIRLMEKSLIEGVPVTDVVMAAAQKFQIAERNVWKDMKEIRRRWAAAGNQIREEKESLCLLAQALRRRDHLYKIGLLNGDLKVALEAEADRCRLLDLYPKKKDEPVQTVKVEVEAGVAVKHEHNVIVSRINEYADVFDQVAARQAALPGSANGNGVQKPVDPQG